MSVLTDFTSYDEIRSLLGVNDDELSDNVLGLNLYLFAFYGEAKDIGGSAVGDFLTIKAVAEGSRTPEQQEFFQTFLVFSSYAVAKELIPSLPLFSPKNITDGKAGLSRYSESPYRDTIESILLGLSRYKEEAKTAYAATGGIAGASLPVISLFLPSSPNYDPVTGQ